VARFVGVPMRVGVVAGKCRRLAFQQTNGENMSTGIVKMYDEDRGSGFIKPDDGGADVFVHAKAVIGASMLIPSQMVEFESVFDQQRGKYRAADVRVI
jgi:CspA family cold shock protein